CHRMLVASQLNAIADVELLRLAQRVISAFIHCVGHDAYSLRAASSICSGLLADLRRTPTRYRFFPRRCMRMPHSAQSLLVCWTASVGATALPSMALQCCQ